MGYAYKIMRMSAVTYPRLVMIVPNVSLDIGLFSICCICKLSNLYTIHKYENVIRYDLRMGVPTKFIIY